MIKDTFLKDSEVLFDEDYYIVKGKYKNIEVGVATTGIGAASAGIAMHELVVLGARNVIRVGTCGKLQDTLKAGDICLVYGAVRNDGLTRDIAPLSFPAVSDPFLFNCILKSARQFGPIHEIHEKSKEKNAIYVCIADTKSDFFLEVPIAANPDAVKAHWKSLKNLGVAASSMECAVLMVKANLLSRLIKEPVRAASILVVVGEALSDTLYYSSDEARKLAKNGEKIASQIALNALVELDKFISKMKV